ncbi:MAG TPA: YfcE family phosphodiesterase [Pseudothermotoga sp.]|nr:YfcE family phosphodiesterase [Pseudothermotoga sp.]
MNVLLVSDLHVPTRLPILPQELLHLASQADVVVAVGDFVDLQTVLMLQASSRQFYAVHGNMDEVDVKEHLPYRALIELESLRIGLCHGWGSPIGIRKRILSIFTDSPNVIFYGHTHQADDFTVGSVRFINPGSFCDNRSFAMVEICGNQLKTVFKKL